MGGTLQIARQEHILDRHRKWDVVVDGDVVGSVRSGSTCEVPLRCGDHEVWVGHRWQCSPVRTYQVHHGEVVEFVCRPRPRPSTWVPYSVASLYWRGLLIVLEQAHAPASGGISASKSLGWQAGPLRRKRVLDRIDS